MAPSQPTASLSADAIHAWETIAQYWDATITKHGNKYWRRLQEPCLARLLGPALQRPGCKALDLATGNGLCARWLARNGAHSVLATDGTDEMLRLADAHRQTEEEPWKSKVRLQKLDVTSAADFARLEQNDDGDFGFDIVLMNMAAMDVADLEPLAGALGKGLLAKDGVFVATLLHPVFSTSGAAINIQRRFNPATGEEEITRSRVITEYMDVPPAKGIAVDGQPAKQLYFHRPMHELFATFFRHGLVMDAMEELAFSEDDGEERIESTSNFTQLPIILAFRMRLP
ncbi:S-adenosyl-L-methionine-dependent methyltransferase [Chaetomium strumarium]|uniref:S-adenosyl-L-methionine-dependent methyltransferase n=1 Tax=Chaetomium strumarium TaxID=1170767 RepID=A0AAJ0GS75_9PEZI|nr:S-adenosyl-L-methionine-dependent methyltransferase [Chaetomium strumarium]